MDATYLFANHFKNIKYMDLPKEVVEITKNQILDYFGVALGGSSKAGVKEVLEVVKGWGGAAQSSVIFWGERLPAPLAAQVNATMAHALDYDDVHESAIMHPGVVTIPTALALAEYKGGISGRELITSVALGTDLICRLGLATRPGESIIPYGWHQTTLYGYMTAAAVAGRILGLSEEEMVHAMGIAYHQSAGNAQCVKDGALTKRLGPGFAVKGGITAALMAQKGITGAKNCLEGAAGFYQVYHDGCYSRDILIGELGTQFETVNVSIKPYPCCRGIHPFIDAALELALKYDISPEDIGNIEMFCGTGTYGLLCAPLEVKTQPRTIVDSQFSAPWGVASALVKKIVGLDDFTEAAIQNEEVLEVASKITVQMDPQFSLTDQLEPGRVKVTLKNGISYSETVEHPLGSPERPLSFMDCEKKFKDCLNQAERPIPAEKTENLIRLIASLEEVNDVKELMDNVVWGVSFSETF